MIRKGIILAGGLNTRLYPTTLPVSKQLLPIYNKPMIYYPLSTLMLAGIRDILIISRPEEQVLFQRLFHKADRWGLNIQFAVQDEPKGLAQALLIGAPFINGDGVALILGDNLFYGEGIRRYLKRAVEKPAGATVFAYKVKDPERYGVVSFDREGKATDIVEKPPNPASSYAVTGLYFYDGNAVDIANGLQPSPRGELEITDLNRQYLHADALYVERLGRGFAWLDTGTQDMLLEASNFVAGVERRQGLMISCPEEIAYRSGYIDADALQNLASSFGTTEYGRYLNALSKNVDPYRLRLEDL